MPKKTETVVYCDFCGINQHKVEKIIAGPNCFICNECVDLCNDIIREEREKANNVSPMATEAKGESA